MVILNYNILGLILQHIICSVKIIDLYINTLRTKQGYVNLQALWLQEESIERGIKR